MARRRTIRLEARNGRGTLRGRCIRIPPLGPTRSGWPRTIWCCQRRGPVHYTDVVVHYSFRRVMCYLRAIRGIRTITRFYDNGGLTVKEV